jgi:hypothetical protein
MGAGNVRLETESAVDTMDFVNKIVNQGKRPADLPLKPQPLAKDPRFGDRLDSAFDFNFPKIPDYEGIQNDLMNFELPSKPLDKKPAPSSYLPKPDILIKGYVASYLQASPHEKTNTSIASLNSMALDKINQRNEDRMQRLGLALNDRGDISTSGLDFTQNSIAKPSYGGDDHLKKVDNVLFDILRSNEPPPSQN